MMLHMLTDADAALRALLDSALAGTAAVSIDPPPADPGSKPRVHAFLVAIREELTGLHSDWEEVRDAAGTTIGRRPPIRRFDLHYVVTAHARDTTAEHTLLDTVIQAVISDLRIPAEHLPPGLATLGLPVLIRLAEPVYEPPDLHDMRARLGVVVNAPLVPPVQLVSAPPERFFLNASTDPVVEPAPRPLPRPLRERRIEERRGGDRTGQ